MPLPILRTPRRIGIGSVELSPEVQAEVTADAAAAATAQIPTKADAWLEDGGPTIQLRAATQALKTDIDTGLSAVISTVAAKADQAALDQAVSGLTTDIATKASTSALALKADAAETTAALSTKVETTTLVNSLAAKADAAATTASLAGKASTTTVDQTIKGLTPITGGIRLTRVNNSTEDVAIEGTGGGGGGAANSLDFGTVDAPTGITLDFGTL